MCSAKSPWEVGEKTARRESKPAIPNYAIKSFKKTSEESAKIKGFLRDETVVVNRVLLNRFIPILFDFSDP